MTGNRKTSSPPPVGKEDSIALEDYHHSPLQASDHELLLQQDSPNSPTNPLHHPDSFDFTLETTLQHPASDPTGTAACFCSCCCSS